MTTNIPKQNKKAYTQYESSKGLHLNYEIICEMIEPETKVLDLGCGSGHLLRMLKDKKKEAC